MEAKSSTLVLKVESVPESSLELNFKVGQELQFSSTGSKNQFTWGRQSKNASPDVMFLSQEERISR